MLHTAPLLCNACIIADSFFSVNRKRPQKVFFFRFSAALQRSKRPLFPMDPFGKSGLLSALQAVGNQPAYGDQRRGAAQSRQFSFQHALCHCSASIRLSKEKHLRLVSLNRRHILSFFERAVNGCLLLFHFPLHPAPSKKRASPASATGVPAARFAPAKGGRSAGFPLPDRCAPPRSDPSGSGS